MIAPVTASCVRGTGTPCRRSERHAIPLRRPGFRASQNAKLALSHPMGWTNLGDACGDRLGCRLLRALTTGGSHSRLSCGSPRMAVAALAANPLASVSRPEGSGRHRMRRRGSGRAKKRSGSASEPDPVSSSRPARIAWSPPASSRSNSHTSQASTPPSTGTPSASSWGTRSRRSPSSEAARDGSTRRQRAQKTSSWSTRSSLLGMRSRRTQTARPAPFADAAGKKQIPPLPA